MKRLDNKVALITGAGSGIGEATARLFGAQGARVVVAGRRPDSAERVAAAIRAEGGHAIATAGDMGEEADIEAIVATAIEAYGRIDVLHNNAAITNPELMARDRDVVNTPADVWDQVLAVNLRGPALMCRLVIPHMIRTGGGSVIMTGSGKGIQGDLAQTAYGASKSGLINLTRNIAAQYGKQNIRANIMVIGLVMTETLEKSFSQPALDMITSHHLTPFLGSPQDVAYAALYLASDESRFITGHEFFVDGGFASHSPAIADLRKFMAAGQGR